MRLRHRSSSLLLILISCLHLTAALLSLDDTLTPVESKQAKQAPEVANAGSKASVAGTGTKDAPIDGKDGRPHLGPFVETNAERDRKKAKDSSADDTKVQKPIPSAIADAEMPETNDGVMDDPNRSGPKEGTRGTEGGISDKNRDKKEGQLDSAKSEKKPDPPKEVPPLPHSEQKNLEQKSAKDDGKKAKEELKEADDKLKDLGGLEVRDSFGWYRDGVNLS